MQFAKERVERRKAGVVMELAASPTPPSDASDSDDPYTFRVDAFRARRAGIDAPLLAAVAEVAALPRSERGERHMELMNCLLYTSPSPRDATLSRMPSSA